MEKEIEKEIAKAQKEVLEIKKKFYFINTKDLGKHFFNSN